MSKVKIIIRRGQIHMHRKQCWHIISFQIHLVIFWNIILLIIFKLSISEISPNFGNRAKFGNCVTLLSSSLFSCHSQSSISWVKFFSSFLNVNNHVRTKRTKLFFSVESFQIALIVFSLDDHPVVLNLLEVVLLSGLFNLPHRTCSQAIHLRIHLQIQPSGGPREVLLVKVFLFLNQTDLTT